MSNQRTPRVLVDALHFPESPRWHGGRLWFSDFFQQRVFSVGLAGDLAPVVDVPGRPSGLGWRPDGTLLVVSMTDRRLLALRDGALTEVADLSALATGDCNDLLVDAAGRAWVGNFGFDLLARESPRPTCLARVDPDGRVHVAATDLLFPNGMAMSDDGRTLVVAETFGERLTAFDVAPDGTLSGHRVFAALPGCSPDGICLDAQGALWVADARGRRALRVIEGAGIVDSVSTGTQHCYACMLGGDDGRTLFLCTAPGIGRRAQAERGGRIETVRVDVPHAGRP